MKQPMVNTMMEEKFDNLYTPFTAMQPLLKHLQGASGINTVWECCDNGGSAITYESLKAGYKVISTDLISGFNFLYHKPTFDFDMIITNPPFSIKDKILERCYLYEKPFALLLPLTALEGINRGNLFRKYGISVIILDKRIDFTGKKSPWFNASWFVHGIFRGNQLIFEEM